MEIKLHNKLDVGVSESFYNKAKQTSIGFDTTGNTSWNKGLTKDNNFILKESSIKIKKLANLRPKEYYKKTSRDTEGKNNPMYGKKHTDDAKRKIGIKSSLKFKYYSEEKKKNIREKTRKSMSILEDNNKTKMVNSHIKQVHTVKTTICKNGLTIEQNAQLKRIKTLKNNKSNVGNRNSMAKEIIIEDTKGNEINVMLTTEIYKWCRENNISVTYVKKVINKEHNFLYEKIPHERYYNKEYYGYKFKIKEKNSTINKKELI